MAYFCAPIRARLDPEMAKRFYDEGLTDREIALRFCVSEYTVGSWRRSNNLPTNKPTVKEDYLADISQCKKCIYWRGMSRTPNGFSFCHHLLDTGMRREQVDGVCLSQTRRRGKHG